MSEFQRRRIDVAFALGVGDYGMGGAENTITLSGLRVSASITRTNGVLAEASVRVWGMTLEHMRKFITLRKPMVQERANTFALTAGYDGGTLSRVLAGNISSCWADFNTAPEVALNILVLDGGVLTARPVPVISGRGAVKAEDLIKAIAEGQGAAFENRGIDVVLYDPYLWGSPWDQIKQVAEAGRFIVDIQNMGHVGAKVIIQPRIERDRSPTIKAKLVTPDTGLVGYPTITQGGIIVRTMFDPAYDLQHPIEVRSDLTIANGVWWPFLITTDLESEMPDGQWFSTLTCYRFPAG